MIQFFGIFLARARVCWPLLYPIMIFEGDLIQTQSAAVAIGSAANFRTPLKRRHPSLSSLATRPSVLATHPSSLPPVPLLSHPSF